MTLELPLRTRGAVDARTREAHLMPSDERIRSRVATAEGSPGELPVSPESLQLLVRHLISDPATARQMAVSPAKALRKLPYLTDGERRHLP